MADARGYAPLAQPSLSARRRRVRRRFFAGAFGLTLLVATIIAPPRPRLIWNASASEPIGLYAIDPYAPLARGDRVASGMPPAFQPLAVTRGYVPAEVPLIKRIAATAGDVVCADRERVFVNGVPVAVRLRRDDAGRPLPCWRGCRRLNRDQLLLLGEGPRSFDGRYFGLSGRADMIGLADPLWLR